MASVTERSLAPDAQHRRHPRRRSSGVGRATSRSSIGWRPSTSQASTAPSSTQRRCSPRTAGPGCRRTRRTSSTSSSTSAAACGSSSKRLPADHRRRTEGAAARGVPEGAAPGADAHRGRRTARRPAWCRTARHYVCATFRPLVPDARPLDGVDQGASGRLRRRGLADAAARDGMGRRRTRPRRGGEPLRARRVEVGLSQMGLRLPALRHVRDRRLRLRPPEPDHERHRRGRTLSRSGRGMSATGLPRSIVDEFPYAGDTSPVWSLLNDDLLIRRDHLRLGDRYIGDDLAEGAARSHRSPASSSRSSR